MKPSEGWDIELIKRIKSKLSVKIFLLTAFLLIVCCAATYLCIGRFAPYVYSYDLSDVEGMADELAQELTMAGRAEAPFYIATMNEILSGAYDDEFLVHIFSSSGEELDLSDLDTLTGKRIENYGQENTTAQYSTSFVDTDEQYIVLIAKNTEKESQIVEALQKALPILSVAILIISVVAAFFYAWYLSAPIKKISRLSRQMATMDFSGLCPVGRSDEIGVLSDSLNELSGKLSVALSELQEANKRLQADIDKERQLERQRSEFFSAASHELKTPITIIKGQLQGMLCQVGRYKDRETYLAQSLEVTNTLEQMVQELLTVSRLETPGYTCTKHRFDFSQLIEERIAAFDDLLVQKELSLEKSLYAETYLIGDAGLLQKAVDNLISNAVSYSPTGNSISVKLWTDAGKVHFAIENTGVHIPVSDIPKLHEAFYRVDPSRNRKTGGSGLGLYIVKTILDLHDGKMEISNTLRGVMVEVTI